MTGPQKRKISAREILADMRAGMTESQLRVKYALTNESLKSVYGKLVAKGVLKEAELPGTKGAGDASPPETSRAGHATCPSCNASLPLGEAECPVCGVVLAKLAARGEVTDPGSSLTSGDKSLTGRRWIYLATILGVCVLAGALFILFSGGRKQKAEVPIGKPDTAQKTTKKQGQIEETSGKRKIQELYLSQAEDKTAYQHATVIDFEFSEKGFPLGLSVSQGSGLHLFDTPSADQGFKKFPPESGAKRHYDQFSIAGATFLVITEESEPPKFYFDGNRNKDLTDDPGPFLGEQPGLVPNHFTILLRATGTTSGVPYRMWLFPSRMGGVRFYPQCHWYAELELHEKKYNMVLFDSNADGNYANNSLAVDVDNDGKAGEAELMKPGETILVDGIPVKLLAIAPSGRWAALEY
jgi:hypothetical protein